jgi:serine/threonine-protein kinase
MPSKEAVRRVGTTLKDKYRLDAILGEGGMAVVYVATHRNQKRVAVKMLHTELSHNDDIRSRFLREGYVANTVKHPGAVDVLDDDIAEDGAAFLVMELLEGIPLEELARPQPLPPHIALLVGHQLVDVLAAAHAKGIIHRDIKPANLFLTEDGSVKVLDFGIARIRTATASASATSTGAMLGTPAFSPPEQALGKAREIDDRTDLWSAGATLFQVLSGQMVHEGETIAEVLVRAATFQARSLATVAPAVPLCVVQVVDRALAFHKANRFENASAMRSAIHDAYVALRGEPPRREVLAAFLGTQKARPGAGHAAFGRAASNPGPRPSGPPPNHPTHQRTEILAHTPTGTPLTGEPVARTAPTRSSGFAFGVGSAVLLTALSAVAFFVRARVGGPARPVPVDSAVTITAAPPPPAAAVASAPVATASAQEPPVPEVPASAAAPPPAASASVGRPLAPPHVATSSPPPPPRPAAPRPTPTVDLGSFR